VKTALIGNAVGVYYKILFKVFYKKYPKFQTNVTKGLNCKCGKRKCKGILKFNEYRHIDWQKEYYQYCGILFDLIQ
jgi:hypothetical protein